MDTPQILSMTTRPFWRFVAPPPATMQSFYRGRVNIHTPAIIYESIISHILLPQNKGRDRCEAPKSVVGDATSNIKGGGL
jgi:hypothetical protein